MTPPSHTPQHPEDRMKNIKIMTLATTAMTLLLAPAAFAEITLNALFMSQAAYSEADVRAMTAEFETANPGTKVTLEFVPYDALHDKIVAASGSGASCCLT
jgi:multiple sugar transport system substrate-binding protein